MWTRRTVVAGIGVSALALPASAAEKLRATPRETAGPFYPKPIPAEHDADLTRLAGRSQQAAGEIIEVAGHVLRLDGTPAAGAKVELWQANAAGRYDHEADRSDVPLDPNFQGYATLTADAAGRFRFVTVKPAAYRIPGGDQRTPHLHFLLSQGETRLTTQMYFPGEALNETDMLMTAMARRNEDPRLMIATAATATAPGMAGYAWDIVLR